METQQYPYLGVKCGNCRTYHATSQAVRECYFPTRPSRVPRHCSDYCRHPGHDFGADGWCSGQPTTNGATESQVTYLVDLGLTELQARQYTKVGASAAIDRLKRERRMNGQIDAPNRRKTKIPLSFLSELQDGYYASTPDSNRAYTFFRVSRPKSGRFKGTMKIQTQHGPDLKLALVIYSFEGEGNLYWWNMSVEDDLLLVAVDQRGCAIAYAEKIGKCMRCNAELTDQRSRWYGIGPECEKYWPWVIPEVDDRKGAWHPGMGE